MSRTVACAALVLLFVGTVNSQLAGTGSSAQRALGVKFNALGCAGTGVVRYTSTSSVLGIGAVKRGATTGTDFALSDIPDLPCSGTSPLLNIPYGIGLMAVHAKPGAITGLSFAGCALDRIFKCVAKTWNDPVLVAANSRLRTVTAAIKKIARAEVSGTTSVFTSFLGKTCPTWKFGSITLMSNAAALKPCFATMIRAAGNAGVAAAFTGTANCITYASASVLNVGEVKLKARTTPKFYSPAGVNTAILVAGLNYGAVNCNPLLDVTAKGDTYPLAYVAFFMVQRKRAGKPNPKNLKTLCLCVASTKQSVLFTGLPDYKQAPVAMQNVAKARCNLIS